VRALFYKTYKSHGLAVVNFTESVSYGCILIEACTFVQQSSFARCRICNTPRPGARILVETYFDIFNDSLAKLDHFQHVADGDARAELRRALVNVSNLSNNYLSPFAL
jgi:hypothetical protein